MTDSVKNLQGVLRATDRAATARISGAVAKAHGNTGWRGSLHFVFTGCAGQSFGFSCLPGLDLEKPEKPAEPQEPTKPEEKPAEPAFAIGARVEARYNGGESWYPGKIFSAHPDDTYFVKYDDGDEEDNIPASDIRPEPAAEPA